jgi:hypothetical protein
VVRAMRWAGRRNRRSVVRCGVVSRLSLR